MELSEKQCRFISEYMVSLNGARSAVLAGYSQNSAKEQACRLLTKAHVRVEIQKRFRATEKRLRIQRDDVISGLLEAAQEARAAGNPMAMISAWREIGKMLGYYDQPASTTPQDQVEVMSDEQLRALVRAPV